MTSLVQIEKYGKSREIWDYVFWGCFIFFMNPGGILKALGENAGDGGINVTDILFAVMAMCFLVVSHGKLFLLEDNSVKRLLGYSLIFLVYFFVVFSFFTPQFRNNPGYSVFQMLIKSRYGVVNFALMFLVYEFFLRSYPIFIKMFLYSSAIVILLFVVTVVTGIDLMPVKVLDRKFVATKRLVMDDHGIMKLLIPMGLVAIVFKMRSNLHLIIMISFALMFLAFVLSLTRRYIFGTFILYIITLVLYNFLRKKPLIPIVRFIYGLVYLIGIWIVISFFFPEYAQSAIVAGQETWNVFAYGQTSTGKVDVRLGFGKEFMQQLIIDNPLFGTGFDNRWRTKVGDAMGYESSDYPFLGAMAMFGVVGLLLFLPLYVFLAKMLWRDVMFIRNSGKLDASMELFFILVFIVYFAYDFAQYMNWFLPMSVMQDPKWYVFFGIYLAVRRIFYHKNRVQYNTITT